MTHLCTSLPGIVNSSTERKENVILTLTDYNKNRKLDKHLIETLRSLYSEVYLWPQGYGDEKYARSLGFRGRVIPRTLRDLDENLESGEFDYVGTRLHAGIRALQKGCHSIIVAIDNRSKEISRDTLLDVVPRDFKESDLDVIQCRPGSEILMDSEAIEKWRAFLRDKLVRR